MFINVHPLMFINVLPLVSSPMFPPLIPFITFKMKFENKKYTKDTIELLQQRVITNTIEIQKLKKRTCDPIHEDFINNYSAEDSNIEAELNSDQKLMLNYTGGTGDEGVVNVFKNNFDPNSNIDLDPTSDKIKLDFSAENLIELFQTNGSNISMDIVDDKITLNAPIMDVNDSGDVVNNNGSLTINVQNLADKFATHKTDVLVHKHPFRDKLVQKIVPGRLFENIGGNTDGIGNVQILTNETTKKLVLQATGFDSMEWFQSLSIDTIYFDSNYTGIGDGSFTKPFPTLNESQKPFIRIRGTFNNYTLENEDDIHIIGENATINTVNVIPTGNVIIERINGETLTINEGDGKVIVRDCNFNNLNNSSKLTLENSNINNIQSSADIRIFECETTSVVGNTFMEISRSKVKGNVTIGNSAVIEHSTVFGTIKSDTSSRIVIRYSTLHSGVLDVQNINKGIVSYSFINGTTEVNPVKLKYFYNIFRNFTDNAYAKFANINTHAQTN